VGVRAALLAFVGFVGLAACIPRDDDAALDAPSAVAFAEGDPRAGAAPMYLAPPSADAPPPSPGALNAVVFATSRVGAPYCWGGAGPACFDCSGLTSAAWREGGKRIPRTSLEQAERLPAVPLSMAAPGDILWKPGHVGIYVGGGWVVAAIGKGDVVRYQPASHFVRALRP
jgi:cell wall-associated NlpC family hydrolase